MPALKNLTKDYWKTYKKNAGIEKHGFGGKDASVGSAIDKLNDRRFNYRRSKNDKTLRSYFTALQNLKTAMTKILDAKEFKSVVAQDFQREIQGWLREIDAKLKKLSATYKKQLGKLKQASAEQLGGIFDQFVL